MLCTEKNGDLQPKIKYFITDEANNENDASSSHSNIKQATKFSTI